MRRDPGLDAARAVAMLGVLLAHVALPYMATEIGWAIRDQSSNQAVDLLVWTARQWLMPLFFLVAGWLGARSALRAGLGALLRQRARRLVLPLALFLVPISYAMNALWRWGRTLVPYEAMAAPVPKLEPSEISVTLGHLWYLWYLILLTLAGAAIAAAWRLAPAAWRSAVGRAVLVVDRGGWTAPLLAVPTCALLAATGQLQTDTPLRYTPDPIILAYFGLFYAWGWGLGAVDASREVPPPRRGAIQLACAAAVIAALVPALIDSVDGARPGVPALFGAALSSWLLVNGVLDVCRRWAEPPAVVHRLAAASFWIYVVHLPLVIVLSIAASQVAAPGPLEFVAITALALASCYGTFVLVRPTPLGALFTERAPRATPAPTDHAATARP